MRFPPSPEIRPTPDRVRETLFNWLAPRLPGARCLDLFAGSGVLGLECLSRGAAHVTFVERDGAAVRELRARLAEWGAVGGQVEQVDALRFLAAGPGLLTAGAGRGFAADAGVRSSRVSGETGSRRTAPGPAPEQAGAGRKPSGPGSDGPTGPTSGQAVGVPGRAAAGGQAVAAQAVAAQVAAARGEAAAAPGQAAAVPGQAAAAPGQAAAVPGQAAAAAGQAAAVPGQAAAAAGQAAATAGQAAATWTGAAAPSGQAGGSAAARNGVFDIVFLDPPFGADLLTEVSARLERGGWLAPGALIYMECAARNGLPPLPSGWAVTKAKEAGEVGYHLLSRVTNRPEGA